MKKSTTIKALLLCSLLYGFFIYYQSQAKKAPLHIDEHEWITRGAIFFDLAFLQHDFSNPQWQDYASYDQSKLPEYIYGSLLYFTYHQSPIKTLNDSGFEATIWPQNTWTNQVGISLDQIPIQFRESIDITSLCRRLNVYFGIICLIFIFLIGRKLKSYLLGIVALILLAINPLFQSEMYTAKADIIFLSSLLATFYLSLKYLHQPTMRYLVLLGVSTGITAAAKLHGFLIMYVLTIGLAINYLTNRRWKKTCIHIFIVPSIATAIFLITNPFIWTNPLHNTVTMFSARIDQSIKFCKFFPENCANSLTQRIDNINHDLVGLSNTNNSFHQIPGLDTALLIFGVTILIKRMKQNQLTSTWLLFLSITITIFVTFSMFYRLPRYYMILLPWTCLIESIGVVGVLQAGINFVSRRTQSLDIISREYGPPSL